MWGRFALDGPHFVQNPVSIFPRRVSVNFLITLVISFEAVSSGVCRLREHWLDIDDRRSINRFDRSHF